MNITDWLRHARDVLTETGSPDPEIDARWMAEAVTGMTRYDLKFEGDRAVSPDQLERLDAMLSRRAGGEPVQYILERADFMGLQFYVDRRVLIPRQDTETLVEHALIALSRQRGAAVLDLCTGSGCVGLSLKSLAPTAEVTLADISRDALEVARINANRLGVDVDIRHGDLFRAVGRRRYDLIVSNPPYIPRIDLTDLQREVRYEPLLALDGGHDGLDFYRRIVKDAPAHLEPGGSVYLEVGIGEAEHVLQLLQSHLDCADSGVIQDLNGIDRVAWAATRE